MKLKFKDMTLGQKIGIILITILIPIWAIPVTAYAMYLGCTEGF